MEGRKHCIDFDVFLRSAVCTIMLLRPIYLWGLARFMVCSEAFGEWGGGVEGRCGVLVLSKKTPKSSGAR